MSLRNIALYEENYQTLKNAVMQNKTEKADKLNWNKNRLIFAYHLSKDQYIMLPIPYEKGWEPEDQRKNTEDRKSGLCFYRLQGAKGRQSH